MKKLPLALIFGFACLFMVACGDDKDPRISDADAVCLKVLRAGGTCGNSSGTATTTTTSTVTVTQTN